MNSFDYQTRMETEEFLANQPFIEEEDFDEPPDVDDSVRFCPECEAPNQFGELCGRCRREIECEGVDYPHGD